MYYLWSLLFFSYTLQFSWGWGDLGHRTVAYLTEKYLDKHGAQLVEDLITPDKDFDISDAAVWPDKQKFRSPFTRPWHYIDAEDKPPNSCRVSYETDCDKGGCIISAIENMTHQVQDLSLEKAQRGDALKFLMHFIGDLHQPLHVEAQFRGGNDLHVCFDNRCAKNKNLHSVWDTEIPHKINGLKQKPKHNDEKEPAVKWAAKLFQSQGLRPLQAECSDTKKPLKCPLIWATESNRLNCDFVFKKGVEWLGNNDLGEEYYDEAAPVVEAQILKAGIRLAGWLNALAADRPSGEPCSRQYGKMRIQQEL
ncbi:uncharacterized protein N7446_011107 [Penicillium canescens]|uniref:Uncharacterized protein n=1 Tax=Penicillium canescens TaxID=5083 RepID=A0AAD6NBE5_PENCN|nr:uncharacterized protein N7446_011107 [Penicillium canescens]KAJ6029542.1 hypothetical protein N7444_012529 [Penicillium canescens]KAJ6047972.1 hypothetical protein N7460_004119 [Penicillium canescens]KAJ6048424.1 hypothetical protein N7446_011107 [Penicillium canescens]